MPTDEMLRSFRNSAPRVRMNPLSAPIRWAPRGLTAAVPRRSARLRAVDVLVERCTAIRCLQRIAASLLEGTDRFRGFHPRPVRTSLAHLVSGVTGGTGSVPAAHAYAGRDRSPGRH